jgi:hypothetical protein
VPGNSGTSEANLRIIERGLEDRGRRENLIANSVGVPAASQQFLLELAAEALGPTKVRVVLKPRLIDTMLAQHDVQIG